MQVYLVGGALRDELLGIKPHDKDYVITGATPTELTALGYKQAGRDFPVFLHPKTHEEYALARTEKKSGHGYTGFICGFGPEVTIEEDLKRRDLTVNAIARSEDGTLVDPWGGLHDLKARVLRHVSPAFTEDPLRVLRTARFAAKLSPQGFAVHPATMELMRTMAASGELTALTPERVLLELDKALSTPDPQIFFTVLADCGALNIVLPEYAALTARTVSFKGRAISALDWCCTALRLVNAAAAAGRLSLPEDKLAPCRLGLSCLAFTKNELKALSSRLRLPKASQEAALLCVRHGRDFMEGPLSPEGKAALQAEDCMELFESLDLYRRAERLPLYLTCVSAATAAAAAAAEKEFKEQDRSEFPALSAEAELNAGPNLSPNHNPNQKDQPELQTAADAAASLQAAQQLSEPAAKAAMPSALAAISQEAEAVKHPAAEAAAKAAAGSSTTPTKPEAKAKPAAAAAAETAIKPETKTAAEAKDKANQAADQAEVQAVKSAETAQEPSKQPDRPKLLPKLAAQIALLKKLFAASLTASARDLAAQGLKGPALGAALRQERLKSIAACLKDKRHLT